jgi:hypothetical protein
MKKPILTPAVREHLVNALGAFFCLAIFWMAMAILTC